MTIEVNNLTFDAIIGLLPKERKVSQKVIVNAKLSYKYESGIFINYATLVELIKKNMLLNKHELLEEALLSLHVEIKAFFPQITSINLKVSKPDIISECVVSVGSKRSY